MNTQTAINLAFNALAAGRYFEAQEHALAVISHDPKNKAALTVLGRIALVDRNPIKAKTIFEEILSTPPILAATLIDLSQALRELHEYSDSIAALERAHQLDTNNIQPLQDIGGLYIATGKNSLAANAFNSILKQAPRSLNALRGLAQLGQLEVNSENFYQLEKISTHGESTSDRAKALYSLASIYRKNNQSERFINNLLAANEMQRKTEPPNSLRSYLYSYENLGKCFTNEIFSSIRSAEAAKISPIFVLGMPRSGTSLVERILSRHPDVAAAGELELFKGPVLRQIETYTNMRFPEGLDTLSQQNINKIADAYISRVAQAIHGKPYFIDKTPGNYHIVPLLTKLFPNCRIIYTQRDPIDNCFSILQQPFDDRSPHTYNIDLLALSYSQHLLQMERWKALPSVSFLTVNYESLAQNPEVESKRIFDYCGLQWNKKYIEPSNDDSATFTFSAVQVNKKISTKSIGAWKQYQHSLQPLISSLKKNNVPV